MKNYIRGGQIALHFYRMFRQINGTVLKIAALAFLLIAGVLIYKRTTPYERDMVLHYYFAEMHQSISEKNAVYQFQDPNGKPVSMKVGQFLIIQVHIIIKRAALKLLRES